jgi:hypothetical protein
MPLTLSISQQKTLDYLRTYFLTNDQLPPMAYVKEHFGWVSNNMAFGQYESLMAKGYLEKNDNGKYRFVRLAA